MRDAGLRFLSVFLEEEIIRLVLTSADSVSIVASETLGGLGRKTIFDGATGSTCTANRTGAVFASVGDAKAINVVEAVFVLKEAGRGNVDDSTGDLEVIGTGDLEV